jgi:pseudoazurin
MRSVVLLVVLASFSTIGGAKEVIVKMLTKGPNNTMLVFDPMFLKVNVGDTVRFQPTDTMGHTSISFLVPEGATTWKAAPNKEAAVKMEKPGVYLVECDVHKTMGMVAVVQVGKPVNLAEAKKKAAEESSHMLQFKDRYEKLLAMVK